MKERILHAVPRESWQAAVRGGEYRAESLAGEGFIHCSTEAQILRVANTIFHGRHDLVLLVIEPERLTPELRWDPGVDLPGELFPHLYGPLNLEAVVLVTAFEPGEDGTFTLPAELR